MPQIRGYPSSHSPHPPTQQVMDQCIRSRAEAVPVTTVESTENSFIFPIIDVLDKA